MKIEDFIQQQQLTMIAFSLPPKVDEKGHLMHRWECQISRPGITPETFSYQMGDGHRVHQMPTGHGRLRWAQYTGPLPVRYHPNGSPDCWPRGTKLIDVDKFEATKCREPVLPEVLEALAMDARTITEPFGQSYMRDWARESGYTDGFEAMDVFEAIQKNNHALRRLLGIAGFRALLQTEEEV